MASVMLVGMVAVGGGIVAYTISSQPTPEEVPSTDLIVAAPDENTVTVLHNGGDPLSENEFLLTVNGDEIDPDTLAITGGDGDWPFEVGETITYHSDAPLETVDVDYGGAVTSTSLRTTDFTGLTAPDFSGTEDLVPPEEEEPPTGSLRVETTPSGATIFIDSIERGTSDVTVTVVAGSHTIIAELEGYQSSGAMVTVQEDETVVVHLVLVPLPQEHEPGDPGDVYFVCDQGQASMDGTFSFTSAAGDEYRIEQNSWHGWSSFGCGGGGHGGNGGGGCGQGWYFEMVINGSMLAYLDMDHNNFDLYINDEIVGWHWGWGWPWFDEDEWDLPIRNLAIDPDSINSTLSLTVEPHGYPHGTTLIFNEDAIITGHAEWWSDDIRFEDIQPGLFGERMLHIHTIQGSGKAIAVWGRASVQIEETWL